MTSASERRELTFTPAYKLAELIRKKKLSPVELMEAVVARIEELNPKLNAYLTVIGDQAIEKAREAEKALSSKSRLGPLHGIPISIKDLHNTKGIRTTMASLVFKDFVPDTEGTVVQRLKGAGAIIVGKTNASEFGLCGSSENKLGDACRNPWDTARMAGGSSGGAAAAAAGISPLTQGSDGGGSIRIPCSYCGLFGLKATNGRVPKDFAAWGYSHVTSLGPMTRNVRDAALMMDCIAGPDGLDYTCIRETPPSFLKALDVKLPKLKIAWSSDLGYGQYGVKVDPEVKRGVENAARTFAEMGHNVEEAAPDTGEPFDAWDVSVASRYYIPDGFLLEKHADKIMDYVRLTMECGRSLTGVEVARAWIQIEKMRGVMLDFFRKYDLLLTPTTSVPAPIVGQRSREFGRHFMDHGFWPFTAVFNLTGNPAANVPSGFSATGLPLSLQIVGKLGDEISVLCASKAFEEARPWAGKYPTVS